MQAKIDLTIPKDIHVIEIGPDCSIQLTSNGDFFDHHDSHFYFLDNLQLLPTDNFHFQYIQQLSGNVCNGGYVLKVPANVNTTYQWYRDSIAIIGATDSIYHVPDSTRAGNYNVRVTTAGICKITDPFPIPLNNLQHLRLPADTTLCGGDTALIAPPIAGITYSWNGRSDKAVSISQAGQYTITASDTNDCRRIFMVNVHLQDCIQCPAFVPNAFTPNGDGLNDILKAHFACNTSAFNMQVFNRWGQKIFESNNPGRGWDVFWQAGAGWYLCIYYPLSNACRYSQNS